MPSRSSSCGALKSSARKIESRKSWGNAANNQAWCAFSQPWSRAAATSRGTTRKATRVSEAGRWQMPALLHLPHRRGFGTLLAARTDMVSLPAAILLQRSQLPGAADEPAQHRIPRAGQRLWLDRRLRAGTETGRRVPRGDATPETG